MRFRTGSRTTVISALAVIAALVVACGGGGGGSDEGYVSALCEATNELSVVIFASFAAEDEAKAEQALIGAYESYLDALKDADPPSDMGEYHDQLADGLESAIKLLKEGDDAAAEAAFDAIDLAIEDPPIETQERLQGVAAGIAACEDIDLFDS